jgi:hypothetical protein
MNSTGFKYTGLLKKLSKTLPWLHFSGACLIFVLLYLFTAIHSQLGQEISAGESPGFAWLGLHIFGFMGLAGAYLILVGGLQHAWVRLNHSHYAGALKIPVSIQFLCVGLLAPAVFNGWRNLIPALTFLLLASILMHTVISGAALFFKCRRCPAGSFLVSAKRIYAPEFQC